MTESNTCIFGPLLSPLHDGELPEDRRRDVLEHLKTCSACQAELSDIRRFGAVMSAAVLPTLSQERADQIFSQSQRIAEDTAVEPTHLRYVRWVSGLAAAIFLLAIGQVAYQRLSPPEAGSPMPANVTELKAPVTTNPATPHDRSFESVKDHR